jgi:hypothetical protein
VCFLFYFRYGPSLKHIAEIIERGVREHPELSVGSNTDGIEVRSVGNSVTLKETALIEAFNLKAAIEYQLKNCKINLIYTLFIYFVLLYIYFGYIRMTTAYDIHLFCWFFFLCS